MVQTSSVVLASTITLFAVGTALALPIEERTIIARENVVDLQSRFFGAIIGAAVRIGTRVGMRAGGKAAGKAGKHAAKHEAHKKNQDRKNRRNGRKRRDVIDQFIARDADDSELAARDVEPELYERETEFDELD